MKFLVDIELTPDDGGEPFTVEQVCEHLKTYVFSTEVSFEMSLVQDDLDHDKGIAGDYRTYMITRVEVTPQ